MNKAILICTALAFAVLLSKADAAPLVVGVDPTTVNIEGVTTDLFDVAQGAVVTSSSALFPTFDARNAIGYNSPTSIEHTRTIFSDNPIPTDFIEFHTAQPINLGSYLVNLGADTSVPGENRWAKAFRLYASNNAGDVQSHLISAATISGPYVSDYGQPALQVSDTVNLTGVQFFRMEIDRGATSGFNGPRVIELDGFATIPEPSTVMLMGLGAAGLLVAAKRRRGAGQAKRSNAVRVR